MNRGKVCLIDYGMGNVTSVYNALVEIGADVYRAHSPGDLSAASHFVLPGVGSFPDGMLKLTSGGWVGALTEEVLGKGKLFLGLCLGMQLLADEGHEHEQCPGLGWIPGRVVPLAPADQSIRLPHVGWNDVSIRESSRLCQGLTDPVFYFVHTYVFDPTKDSVTTGICHYGADFTAVVEHQNIMATQFHPEKSQTTGLRVLTNFCQLKPEDC